MKKQKNRLYILLISIHGLIRGRELELGRDADTGGQTKYVVELAGALAERDDVERVDLLTRRVVDPEVHQDYSQDTETLTAKAQIVRLDAGPNEYIRKEELWDHLDNFVDNALSWLHGQSRMPDIIHSHYADAGYAGVRLAKLTGIPLVHTGHSLGRVKRQRLLANGLNPENIEQQYNMARRIEAEEEVLANAELVITSTHNEIKEQYGLYDYYQPECMAVIPPGTNLQKFHPPDGTETEELHAAELQRFFSDPHKPVILALSRPDERKNISTLIEAYGESPELKKAANLVLIAGNREDIRDMDSGPQSVLIDLLLLIDKYDLYGHVAYPKQHKPDEVPLIYRLAAASRGVFVNPALTEPFGLTLLEAAASSLPIVATEDGGPQDIIGNCRNGLLIDPLDKKAMADAMLQVLDNTRKWQKLADNGLKGVQMHYSWQAHATKYVDKIRSLVGREVALPREPIHRRPKLYHDRAIFTDLDQNLLSDPSSLEHFVEVLQKNRKLAIFGIATGRRLESALAVMKRNGIPVPDVLITSIGTEIYYAPQLIADYAWSIHIDHLWNPKAVRRILANLPGLKLQPKIEQNRFKISYYIDPEKAPTLDEINQLLRQEEQAVNTILSFGQFLDIVPVRASKGQALRYFAHQRNISPDHVLAAGGSGADEDMMRGNTLAVVVSNRHHEELSQLTEMEHVYFANQPCALGILEAIDHYDFYGACRVPDGS
jgi:sucrose-phosphate synthase